MAALLVLLATSGLERGHHATGDTQRLVTGSRLLVECLEEGRSPCGRVPGTENETYIGLFPPLQYLPAVAFEQVAGLTDLETVDALAWLNLACFALLCGLLVLAAARRHGPAPPLGAVLLLSGPMLVYATSAFGEMLAATVLVGYVLALRARRPVLVAVTAFLAGTAKETFVPFLLALAALAGRDDDDGWLPPARVLVPLAPGLVAATALTWWLNVQRFGSIWNERYLEPVFRADGPGRWARNAVHVLAAPGGGLAPYWPTSVLLLVALAAAGAAAARRRDLRAALPRVGVLAVLVAFVGTLAPWWAPLGWVAWGPRLLLPLLPALGLVAWWVGGDDLDRLVRRALLHRLAWAAVAAVAAAGAYVSVSGAWWANPAVATLRQWDETCPDVGAPDTDEYWRCLDHRAWRLEPNPIRTAVAGRDAASDLARAVAVGGVLLLLAGARASARRPAAQPAPGPEPAPDDQGGEGDRCRDGAPVLS